MVKNKTVWVEKYRPKSIKEMALPKAKLNRQRVNLAEELRKFIENFFEEIEKVNKKNQKIRAFNRTATEKEQKELIDLPTEKSAVLLEGQPGIGKTSIVYALANDFNMEVIETNASDTRTRDTLEAKLKETSKSRGIMDFITDNKRKLILIDEVDGIYGNKDRGAVPAIIDIIQDTQFPIILCANEYQSNLQPLYNKVPRYEVEPLEKDEILKIMKKIIKKEELKEISKEHLELIINKNNGDLRGVINDLQAISQISLSKEVNTEDMILSLYRDSTEEIFGLLRDLLQKSTTLKESRAFADKSDVDYNFLYKWINENMHKFIYDDTDLMKAYENLSIADEIFGRIRKNMEWSLLPYFFDLFTGGVVIAGKTYKSKGFRRVNFPRYSSSSFYSLNNTEKALVEKIQERYEISQNEAIRNFIPFLKILSNISRRNLKEISDWFDLNAKEKNLLK